MTPKDKRGKHQNLGKKGERLLSRSSQSQVLCEIVILKKEKKKNTCDDINFFLSSATLLKTDILAVFSCEF